MAKLSGWLKLLHGDGPVNPPSPGNRNNAPATPPIQVGNYQWLQSFLVNGVDNGKSMSVLAPFHVPPAYQDWGAYPVNEFDVSGLEGGGIATAPEMPSPNAAPGSLYFDPSTGLYYEMPE